MYVIIIIIIVTMIMMIIVKTQMLMINSELQKNWIGQTQIWPQNISTKNA